MHILPSHAMSVEGIMIHADVHFGAWFQCGVAAAPVAAGKSC